jgi:hypothetical protein
MTTVALFTHDPQVSLKCCNAIMRVLGQDYDFELFNEKYCAPGLLKNVDLVVFPGGIGDADSWDKFFKDQKEIVVDYVQNGGHYLGICMGAYWAGKNYFDILNQADAVQYITRPGTDTHRPHAKALTVDWLGNPEKMYFYDGCAIVGDQSKFTTVSRYANGDPMAIIQNRIGLIGCHPESQLNWYTDYSWMASHWHNGRHHALLKDFVNTLLAK